MLGFFLEPFQHSFRKRLSLKPKFYFFDLGIVRALTRSLSIPLQVGTSVYGEAFEHFVILECMNLVNYFYQEYRFSYLKTKDDAEIDLVVERPGQPVLFIEIKSANELNEDKLASFIRLTEDFGVCEAICLYKGKYRKQYKHVTLYPWQEGIKKFFVAVQSPDFEHFKALGL